MPCLFRQALYAFHSITYHDMGLILDSQQGLSRLFAARHLLACFHHPEAVFLYFLPPSQLMDKLAFAKLTQTSKEPSQVSFHEDPINYFFPSPWSRVLEPGSFRPTSPS